MTVGVLYAQAIASLAAAAPPEARHALEEHREPPTRSAILPRLDLHVPPAPSGVTIQESIPASAFRSHGAARVADLTSQPEWRGDAPQLNDTTRLQELAHGLRRNGLPLARLWQGRGSLLSVGFDPKGKPGLWFTKQLP